VNEKRIKAEFSPVNRQERGWIDASASMFSREASERWMRRVRKKSRMT